MNNNILSVFAIVLLSVTAAVAKARVLPAPQKISEHVYAWIGPLPGPSMKNQGYRMNLGFIVGDKEVVVVDSGYTRAMAKEMLAHIKQITPLPVKYVINTNSQPHRYMGNDVFRQVGAKIIAHADSAARMSDNANIVSTTIERILKQKKGSVKTPAKPNMTITANTSLDLGRLKVNILTFGAAHTPAQLVVEVAADHVIYSGDILYSGRLLAVLPDSHLLNWIQAYDRLRRFKNYTFIPGHGKPNKLSAFEFPTYSYLTRLYQHMNKAVADFTDLQAAIDSFDQTAYQALVNFEMLAGRNASWAYVTLEANSL